MNTINKTVFVNATVQKVFSILSDPKNEPLWMAMLKRVELKNQGPISKGSEQLCVFGFGPITTMAMEAVIEEYEEGRRFVRRRVGGIMPMKGEFIVEPENTNTKVVWNMEVGLRGGVIGRLFEPLAAMWMSSSMNKSLSNFKKLVERD